MQQHPEIGSRTVLSSADLAHIAQGVLSHHERWDGKGYPNGLKGDEIPLVSRIISVVDSYDMMTYERPYKKALGAKEAMEEIERCSGSQFDPEIVAVLIRLLTSG